MDISIIVPIYNSEKYLKRCIESLIHQTFEDIEIILVDDGSLDNSIQICKEYVKKDRRIVLITQENGGPSKARNAGLDKANGEWIMFVDSDDEVSNNICEKLYNKAQETDADMVICNLANITSDMQRMEVRPFKGKERIFKGKGVLYLEQILVSKESETGDWVLNLTGPTSKLIRSTVIKNERFPSKIDLGEDTCFIISIFKNLKKVIYIEDVLYNRYVIDGSLSNGYDVNCGQRLSTYTNWVKEYYKRKEIMIKSVIILEMKNALWVVNNYLKYSQNISDKEKIDMLKKYLDITKFKISIKDIICSNFLFKQKIILFLIRIKMYWVLQILFNLRH
uniref:glycosyltransferase family 2 protein n=1 Tax=Agathobacter sp. TaxID=2021311 RepID=UPI00405687BD